jgi:hypothetical protein
MNTMFSTFPDHQIVEYQGHVQLPEAILSLTHTSSSNPSILSAFCVIMLYFENDWLKFFRGILYSEWRASNWIHTVHHVTLRMKCEFDISSYRSRKSSAETPFTWYYFALALLWVLLNADKWIDEACYIYIYPDTIRWWCGTGRELSISFTSMQQPAWWSKLLWDKFVQKVIFPTKNYITFLTLNHLILLISFNPL